MLRTAYGPYAILIDNITSPCVLSSYHRKSQINFTGEIPDKKITAVPLAAWDGGIIILRNYSPREGSPVRPIHSLPGTHTRRAAAKPRRSHTVRAMRDTACYPVPLSIF